MPFTLPSLRRRQFGILAPKRSYLGLKLSHLGRSIRRRISLSLALLVLGKRVLMTNHP
jgi:hypothetical protein